MSKTYLKLLKREYNNVEELVHLISELERERNRFLTIAYNAIVFGQLDERFSKDELLHELGCSEEEYEEIMG